VISDEQVELELSAAASVLGSSCPSPTFSHFASLPVIGGLETLSVAGATPSAPVFLIAGLPLPVGFPLFPPCELCVDPFAFSNPIVLLADTSGAASIGLPIPDEVAFVGGVIATQAFDILSFAPFTLAHSNAMRLRFGF
jgi:hypothetical protein